MLEELLKIGAAALGFAVYYWYFTRPKGRPSNRPPTQPLERALGEDSRGNKSKKTYDQLLDELDGILTDQANPKREEEADEFLPLRQKRQPLSTDLKPNELEPPSLQAQAAEPPSAEITWHLSPPVVPLGPPPVNNLPNLGHYLRPGRFTEYAPATASPSPLRQLFDGPATMRNAIILAEILKRKWE
ncbi:MAG: hypothetical protein MUC97_16695 [Bernardetiaceae bacterium]|jgi:hypothetical protein|nr:hypothetical protein [Bernardetiaceae bacterium]